MGFRAFRGRPDSGVSGRRSGAERGPGWRGLARPFRTSTPRGPGLRPGHGCEHVQGQRQGPLKICSELWICVLQADRVNICEASTERAGEIRPGSSGCCAPLAQSVERFHGKEKVISSILIGGSVVFLPQSLG